jgi:hypothetical protein
MKRAVLLAGAALLSACGGEHLPTAATTDAKSLPSATAQARSADINQGLATIRRVTAPFHDFGVAGHAGWSAKITSCLVDPGGAGGMGFHFGNTNLIDGTAQVDKPQLLLYEPDQNGRMNLLAVEYIIPYSFAPSDGPPPVLLGQQFLRFDAFGVWGLHAWVWKDNPSGIFAPWNPRVTCSNTADVSMMRHH